MRKIVKRGFRERERSEGTLIRKLQKKGSASETHGGLWELGERARKASARKKGKVKPKGRKREQAASEQKRRRTRASANNGKLL